MAITTATCKAFLAHFVRDNPSVLFSIYGTDMSAHAKTTLLAHGTTPNRWKRIHKCSPGGGLYQFDSYGIFTTSHVITRMGFDRLPEVPIANFVAERGFSLDPDIYDTGVAFVVLEDRDGNLHLGDYIGD